MSEPPVYVVAVLQDQALLDLNNLPWAPIGQNFFCVKSLDIIVQWNFIDRT